MNLESLRVLSAAVEAGTMSAAAEQLNYTPSGVSRAIEALEKHVGFPIIARNRKGVRLTSEGEKLFPLVKEIAYWSNRLDEKAREVRGLETGTVTVGTAYSHLYPWIADVIAQYHQLHPAIVVEIVESSSSDLCDRVENHSVDFAFVNHREGVFHWTPLMDDTLVFLLPLDHPYAEADAAPDNLVETETFVDIYPGRETDNSLLFQERNLHPQVGFSTHDHLAACAIVRAGLGITLVNELFTLAPLPGVAIVPLDPVYPMEFGIATPEERFRSPAAQNFIDYAMGHIENATIAEMMTLN